MDTTLIVVKDQMRSHSWQPSFTDGSYQKTIWMHNQFTPKSLTVPTRIQLLRISSKKRLRGTTSHPTESTCTMTTIEICLSLTSKDKYSMYSTRNL